MAVQLVEHVLETAHSVRIALEGRNVVRCCCATFAVTVATELEHLGAIEEWWRDGVEHVGCTDEKNLQKIGQHINVIILSIVQIVPRPGMSGSVKGRILKATFCSRSSTWSRAGHHDSLTDRLCRSHLYCFWALNPDLRKRK